MRKDKIKLPLCYCEKQAGVKRMRVPKQSYAIQGGYV